MPVISRFFGIAIRMYYLDHAPPHFHAHYGEHELVVSIRNLEIIEAPSDACTPHGHRVGVPAPGGATQRLGPSSCR